MQRSLFKINVAFVYSMSALLAAVTLFACNDNNAPESPVITTQNPQPGATPTCPEMNISIPIAMGAIGKGPNAYGANPMVIPQGAMVTWVNQDEYPHTATAMDGEWDTETIMPGQSSEPKQFMTVGTVPYFCMIHGPDSMSGTLEVTPLPSGCPMPTPSPSASPTGEPGVEPTEGPAPAPSAEPTGTPTMAPYGWN